MKESLHRIDVVIFEIEALQPRIVPVESLRLTKRFEQILLGYPINSTKEQFRFGAQCTQGEAPAREDPVCLVIPSCEMLLSVREELVLNIERVARAAIFERDHATPGAV